MIRDNELIFDDKLQKSTAQNSLYACSPRESNLECINKDHQRVKSPKDKILVTFYSKSN